MMDEEGTQMKRRRHTPEQVIRKLREAERLLAEGKAIPEVAKQLEVSENTFHRWRAQYGGMKANDEPPHHRAAPSSPILHRRPDARGSTRSCAAHRVKRSTLD